MNITKKEIQLIQKEHADLCKMILTVTTTLQEISKKLRMYDTVLCQWQLNEAKRKGFKP